MNNIIINNSIIKCTNSDNELKYTTNYCTCNDNNCKCFCVKPIINEINIPCSTPFTNTKPPDNDVNTVDKTIKINHVRIAANIKSDGIDAVLFYYTEIINYK